MPAWLGKLFASRNPSSSALRGQTSSQPQSDAPHVDLASLKSQGDALLGNGDFAAAERIYRQITAIDVGDARSLYKLAFAQKEIGHTHNAANSLKRAAIIDPALADCWYIFGETALASNSQSGATEAQGYFSRCLSIDPQFEAAYSNLCQILLSSQRLESALQEKAQFEAAIETYNQTLHIAPLHLRARLNQASCQVGLGNISQAQAILDAAIDQNPENADAQWNRFLLKLLQGDFTNGWREYDYRWMLDREDCPWYPTMRLFRQSQIGNWIDVITSLRIVLLSHFELPDQTPREHV